jgi:two-component system, OmpR family, response regulator CpxR
VPAKKATLLCVDDDAQSLAVRRLLLEAHGFNVVTSINPKQSLRLFRTRRFDAAVVDYQMPEMNGAELAKEMKSERVDVPVVILSGLVELPEGAPVFHDRFVCKAESSHKLVKEIQSLIEPKDDGGIKMGVPMPQRFIAFSALALGFVVEGLNGLRTRTRGRERPAMNLKSIAARA